MIPRVLRNAGMVVVLLTLAAGSAASDCWAADAQETAGPAVVITDIASWQHPVKKVLEKYEVKLVKVELLKDRKYPVFHVASWPAEPLLAHNDPYFSKFLLEIFKANGKWPFTIQCDDEHDGFDAKWDSNRKLLLWNFIGTN